jgi:hypothetical protein
VKCIVDVFSQRRRSICHSSKVRLEPIHSMGNVMSDEEAEKEFLEEGFDLESPDADQKINYGTSAPNCQPQHTQREVGQEVVMEDTDDGDGRHLKHDRASSTVSEGSQQEPENKRLHSTAEQAAAAQQNPKKMSYIQMAKLGYQELINAIIRPPRADYKVSEQSRSDYLPVA